MHHPRKSLVVTLCLGLIWVAAVALGLRYVLNYDNSAGAIGAVPSRWPAKANLQRASDRFTLVMLAHPRCPCTRATIGELARIMAVKQGSIDAFVLFYRPAKAPADWDDTDLRRSAAAIPGVKVVTDVNGAQTRLFGAETSGHTLLFDPAGNLLFSGGITDSRGHAGGNKGESAIIALASHEQPVERRTLVFGCRIADRSQSSINHAVCSR